MVSQERYDIIRLIEKDSSGGLFYAEDTQLNRPVFLKRLHASPSHKNTETTLPRDVLHELQLLFQRLATLSHPNISAIIDANLDADGAYIVYEHSESKSLLHLLREAQLFSESEALDIAQQILEALNFAHQKEHYHGSLSLQSIRLRKRPSGGWHVQIQDFGQNAISSILHSQSSESLPSSDPISIAPELWQGAAPSARSDIYAFGHLIYTLLAGGHPYAQLSREEITLKNRRNLLPLLCDVSDTRPAISEWVHQCLEPNPHHRSSSIAEILPILSKLATNGKPQLNTPSSEQQPHLQSQSYHRQPQQTQTPASHSNKSPILICITLIIICLALSWKSQLASPQPHSGRALKTAQLTTPLTPPQKKSQEHNTDTTHPSPLGIRQESTRLRQFSQHDSLYAHWHFSPEYFLGKNYYLRDPKIRFQLTRPPKFKDNTLNLQSDQPILLHSDLARKIPRDAFTLEALALVTKPQSQGGIISCSEDSPFYRPHWVHLIGVFNEKTLRLYVNGNQVATAPHGHKMTMAKQLPDFTIGGYRDSDTQTTMQGQIRAIAIYRRALHSKDVKELFSLRQSIHLQ